MVSLLNRCYAYLFTVLRGQMKIANSQKKVLISFFIQSDKVLKIQ